jgi:Ser/Thr protein kinase RdoA (MazF antagonist)
VFPTFHALLSTTALLAQLQQTYDLDVQSIRLLSSGLNDTYQVTTSTRPYIYRIYRHGWRTLADIRCEIDLLHHLDQAGVPISAPVPTKSGDDLSSLAAPEGTRWGVLLTYLNGSEPDTNDLNTCQRFGKAFARMHSAADDFSSSNQRFELDLAHLLDEPLAVAQPLMAGYPAVWDDLSHLAHLLRTKLTSLIDQNRLDWGFCHGDLHAENSRQDQERIAFFDFDCGGYGWRAYDLAVFYRGLHGYGRRVMPEQEPNWQAFLAGYQTQRPLSAADLAAIPYFVAARQIWMLGIHIVNAPKFGYERFSARYFTNVVSFIKDWHAAYLKAN